MANPAVVGDTVAQYQIVARLGQGLHSAVYKAWQQSLARYVALKVLTTFGDEAMLQKFQTESRLTAYLIQQGVPNIRQLYEVGGTPDGLLFVALEYVEDSLENSMRRARERGRNAYANPAAAAKLLSPVAEALDALHELGWVHLDIKPQNILITGDGRALLADFGIAQRRGTQTRACTPLYASPEQAAGDRPVGPWSDIYSLGVVLYEMVAGHPPFQADQDIVVLNQHVEMRPTPPLRPRGAPQLSIRQERAILDALAKVPERRHPTAGSLIAAMMQPDTFASTLRNLPYAVRTRGSGLRRRMADVVVVAGLLVLLLTLLFLAGRALWPRLPFQPSDLRSPAVASTPAPTSLLPTATTPATVTRPPVIAATPAGTDPAPTVTLAPTSTRAPRPTVTRTAAPMPTAPAISVATP